VQIVAGTPPGGGLDRVARALAKAIVEGRLINVPVEIVNIPGGGARRAWTHYIDNHPRDSHVIGISSPNLTTDYLVGAARFEHSKYTPIATLVTEYIAFGVKSDSSLKTGDACGCNRADLGFARHDIGDSIERRVEHPNGGSIDALMTQSADCSFHVGVAAKAPDSRSGPEIPSSRKRPAINSESTVALSTALGNPNHLALAKLTRQSGGSPTGRVS
jgi:hypothetical protein